MDPAALGVTSIRGDAQGMRARFASLLVTALAGLLCGPARAQDVNELSSGALEALSEAAAAVVIDDRARVEDATPITHAASRRQARGAQR